MNYALLLGAGFSRNWGGWLADEAFEYLLGCRQINMPLRELLISHKRKGGFEAALAELQEGEFFVYSNLKTLHSPIFFQLVEKKCKLIRVLEKGFKKDINPRICVIKRNSRCFLGPNVVFIKLNPGVTKLFWIRKGFGEKNEGKCGF